LHLKARVLTDALLMGAHRSRRVGQAVEFADYQEYRPGMDLRFVDWKVWARSDRIVVKRFETETEFPCTIVLDLSADLGTGEQAERGRPDLEGSKAGYGITLAATLLYWFHRHGEPVGLEIVAGAGVTHRSLPTRSSRNHLQQLFVVLASVRPGGTAELRSSLLRVGSRVPRRSWVGVITDGMEEPSQWVPALGAFARRGTDLRLFHLFDPQEWSLDYSHPALFFSPEGGAPLPVDPKGAQDTFRLVAAEYAEEVRAGVTAWGGLVLSVGSHQPMDQVIARALAGGRR